MLRRHLALALAVVATCVAVSAGQQNTFTPFSTSGTTTTSGAGVKASIGGTPDGTKFLRDDWIWVAGGGGGEVNTASNIGSGAGWFKQKTGVDFELKSVVAGSARLTVTSNANDLTLDVPSNAFEAAGAVATHAAAGDPHTGYQLESGKNAASGYAGLDGNSKLTGAQQVYGTGANTAAEGNDARLSDARTPTAHASTHRNGGSDVLALHNANTSDVTANAADTYLTGSNLTIGPGQKAGTILRWRFIATKTAAGTAAAVFSVRWGTNGTTADTARNTFTLSAQTAATDTGSFDLVCVVRSESATGTVACGMSAAHQTTGTTGLWSANEVFVGQAVSATFDNTSASLIAGVSCNPGASGVWTFQVVTAEATNLQ